MEEINQAIGLNSLFRAYGGLIKPTVEWLTKVKKWNLYFEKRRKKGLFLLHKSNRSVN